MRHNELKLFLENQYALYHSPEYLRLDPLICLKGFASGNDLEIAGLVASVLAYGRAEIIIRNVSEIFKRTGRCITRFSIDTSLRHKRSSSKISGTGSMTVTTLRCCCRVLGYSA